MERKRQGFGLQNQHPSLRQSAERLGSNTLTLWYLLAIFNSSTNYNRVVMSYKKDQLEAELLIPMLPVGPMFA